MLNQIILVGRIASDLEINETKDNRKEVIIKLAVQRNFKNENGEIDHLECEYIENTKSGNDTSGIKCKGTIHFVSSENCFEVTIRNFKNLTKAEYIWPSKALEDGVSLEDVLTENSLTETKALAENFLKEAKVGDKFQFMRKGYFCLDKDSTEENYIFNNTISLKDSFNK